jgi:hypothetical protein
MKRQFEKYGAEKALPVGPVSRRWLLASAAKLTGGAVALSALGGVTAQATGGTQAGTGPSVAESAKGKSFAFFETCSRVPNPTNSAFVIARKMDPVRKGYKAILATIERLGAPVLSTTCLGIQRNNPTMSVPDAVRNLRASASSAGLSPDVAFVPVNATPEEVAQALQCKYIRLERLSCPNSNESCQTGIQNVERRTYDMFYSNKNTAKIVQALGERHWLVFGAGGEYCLVAAAEGLRALGMQVTILLDGCIHMASSTPQSFLEAFDRLKSLGVQWSTLSSVMNEPERRRAG